MPVRRAPAAVQRTAAGAATAVRPAGTGSAPGTVHSAAPLGRRGPRVASGLPWILPAVVLVVGVVYFALGYTGWVSTLDWNGFILSEPEPVGGANYAQMASDPVFWGALGRTAVFFVVTFSVQTVLGFVLAALLHSGLRFRSLYKVLVFTPTVLAPAIMAPVFRQVFDANGQLNDLLRAVGLDALARPWLAGGGTALAVVMAVTVWQWTGLTFILFYAAMSQVDPEVLEAARLDGAGNLRTLRSVVWPMVRGTTAALALLGLIGALKTFDVPYLVTKGGPNHATEFLGTYVYSTMVQEKHFGYAAAVSVALLVLAVGGGVLVTLRNRRAERG